MSEKIRVIHVDDETNSRDVLRTLIGRNFPELEWCGEASNAQEAYDLIQQVKPQLVFLDIQMPKADGFSLLRRFEEIPFEVVFVTSFDKYAINAIRFSALDYLLKPIDVKDLAETILKARKRIAEKKSISVQIANLLHNMDHDEDAQKIAVHAGENVKLIDRKKIMYIQAEGSYCNILTTDNERFVISWYLKEVEEYFSNSSVMIRISKSLMINSVQISSYSKGEPCIIEMVNGETFEVSRRKKVEILALLSNKAKSD
ncbi:Transcriptional regulatory protein YehT [compost metagenome]